MNRQIRTDVQVGTTVEDCSLNIGEVIDVDPIGGHLHVRSMFDGIERGCDLYHCGIEVQTQEDIDTKTAAFKAGGMKALVALFEERVGHRTGS